MKELNNYVKINTIKVGDEDRYIITCGKYQLTNFFYTSEEEAEEEWKKIGFKEEQIGMIMVFACIAWEMCGTFKIQNNEQTTTNSVIDNSNSDNNHDSK